MKLVLDTNVVVSAFLNPPGKPSQVLKLVINRNADLYYNTVILTEYESVMLRPKFSSKINPSLVSRFIDIIRSIGTTFDPLPGGIKLQDAKDQIFYDTAKESGSYLITGNLKHFPKHSFIISPAEFLLFRQMHR